MAESGIRRRQSRIPGIGCRLPGDGLQSAELGSRRPIKNGNPGFRRCPERNMRLCWGRLKIPKNQKHFGRQKVVSRYPKHLISSHFSLRGRFFEKKTKKNSCRAFRAFRGTESRPAAHCQTLGTVRMLSGLRSWTSTNSLKLKTIQNTGIPPDFRKKLLFE